MAKSKVSALETLFRLKVKKKNLPGKTISLVESRNCPYCGRLMSKIGPLELTPTRDHFLPRSRGHTLATHNKVICCQGCNVRKRDRGVLEWLRELRKSRDPLDRVRCLRLNHFVEHRQRHGLPIDDAEEIVTTC